MTDPFGRALADHAREERTAPLYQVDGETEREHPIQEFYFGPRTADTESTQFRERWLDGPLLDVGAGVGRDTLYFQAQFETVGLEVSEHLVETMRERGVERAVLGDMFALSETFSADRFASLHVYGTQVCLARSLAGLTELFVDFARVTTPDATAIVDGYDPTVQAASELLGYRAETPPGLASRTFHFRYESERGETLLFRLYSPERLREALAPTPWTVETVHQGDGDPHYVTVLTKETATTE